MVSQSVIRVVLVDDSALARNLLRDLLHEHSDIRVIGEAQDGQEAIALVARLKPDVVCMDLNMPVMDGAAAIDAIMHQKAVPILVVSSESDAPKAYQALSLGALEVMAKPSVDSEEANDFVNKVRLLAGVSVITRIRPRSMADTMQSLTQPQPTTADTNGRTFKHLVAIACSTGGPQALAYVLPRLSPTFAAPVLISQHICDGFVDGMVQWLSGLSALPVKVAQDGELIVAGQVYVSPSESHMTVTPDHRIALRMRQTSDIYRPCCNLLFESVAEAYASDAIGLIMTGMGRDGASGIKKMRDYGGATLAQDESSSVIFGMNHEAIVLGGIEQILTLADIPAHLNRLVR